MALATLDVYSEYFSLEMVLLSLYALSVVPLLKLTMNSKKCLTKASVTLNVSYIDLHVSLARRYIHAHICMLREDFSYV